MESDDLEAPETPHVPDLEAYGSAPERARRLRRFAVDVESHASLLNPARRLRRQRVRTGRSKRLRADGAPRDLHVVRISRD